MRLASVHTYPVKGCYRLDHDGPVRVESWGLAGDRRWMIVDGAGNGVTQRETTALVDLAPLPRSGGLLLRAPGRPPLDVPEPVAGEPVDVRVFNKYTPAVARRAGTAADEWLTDFLGRPVRLVWLADPTGNRIPDPAYGDGPDGGRVSFADGFPLLLANLASLDGLNMALLESGSVEGPLPMTRFRPNLVIAGADPWAEEGWTGRRLRVGPASFRIGDVCGRCVVTTVDQETGEKGHEPLRVLGALRRRGQKLPFGMNLIPELPPAGTTHGDGTDGAVCVAPGDPVEVSGPGWPRWSG